MQAAHQAKTDKILDTEVRYETGVMSRRDWLNFQKDNGATVRLETKPRAKYSRTKANRLSGEAYVEYERKCNEQVPAYYLYEGGKGCYEITKTEYDYFLSRVEVCIECGEELSDMSHNYGTEEFPVCIRCYGL